MQNDNHGVSKEAEDCPNREPIEDQFSGTAEVQGTIPQFSFSVLR